MQAWILRFGELGLKSKVVRGQFQSVLRRNMERLALNSGISLFKDQIKTMDVVSSTSPSEDAENILCHVLGIVAIDPAKVIADTIETGVVAKAILATDTNFGNPRTFGVRTKRVGPRGNYRSQQYSADLGHALCTLDESLSVDLTNPDMFLLGKSI